MVTAIILVAAMLLLSGAVLLYQFKTRVWIWSPLPSNVENVSFVAPKGYDAARVSAAFDMVAHLLAAGSKWNRQQVSTALKDSYIFVVNADSWLNTVGQRVAGEQDGAILKVGRDLAALCHEAAHLCELRIDKARDDAHAGWDAKGIWRAIDAYAEWLKGRKT